MIWCPDCGHSPQAHSQRGGPGEYCTGRGREGARCRCRAPRGLVAGTSVMLNMQGREMRASSGPATTAVEMQRAVDQANVLIHGRRDPGR